MRPGTSALRFRARLPAGSVRALLLLGVLLVAAGSAVAWGQAEHNASGTVLPAPAYEGRDTVGTPSVPLPNVYAAAAAAGTWTAFAPCDDCTYTATPGGLAFPFYGTPRSSVQVSTNGFLGFQNGMAQGCCTGDDIPDTSSPNDIVVGFWEDLNPNLGGTLRWTVLDPYNDPARQVFVADWNQICHYGGSCTWGGGVPPSPPSGPIVSMQIHLFEDSGAIEVHYDGATTDGGTHSAGMESGSGQSGIRHQYGAGFSYTTESVQYRPFGLGPIARPDLYALAFSPGATLDVDGSTAPKILDNDVQIGNLPLRLDLASVTTPVLPDGTPWGTLVSLGNDGSFEYRLGPACPWSGPFDVRFQYRDVDDWQPGAPTNVSVRVTGCNVDPVAGDDALAVPEGSGPHVLDVLANDVDPGDNLTIVGVSYAGPGTLAVDPTGTFLRFTPPYADFNGDIHGGPLSATYTVQDTFGVTDTARLDLTVDAVNDAPSFVAGPALLAVDEGAAPYAAPWASALARGPAGATDEAAQLLRFEVSDDRPGLFAPGGRPAIDDAGVLTFTLADADVNRATHGDATVTVRLLDSGPGAAPHENATATVNLTLRVAPRNDPPVFTPGPAVVTVQEGDAAVALPWATDVRPGPAGATDEAGQNTVFEVSVDDPSLFAPGGLPALDAAGTLTFTLVDTDANRLTHGEPTVTVRLRDDGPGAAPDANASAAATLRIVVDPVNDAPSALAGPDVAVDEGLPLERTLPGWLAGSSPGGGADEAGQTVSFDAATTVREGRFDLFSTPPQVDPDGTLRFTLTDPEAPGLAEVVLTPRDDGPSGPPHATTGTALSFLLRVLAVNDAPVAVDDALPDVLPTMAGQVLPDVLANDLDPDGPQPLRVQALDAAGLPGTLALDADGRTLRFSPDAGVRGPASFRYRAWDGETASDWAEASFVIEAPATPLVAIATDARLCRGPVTLDGLALLRGHTTESWTWDLDGTTLARPGGADLDRVRHTFPERGSYPVALDVLFTDGAATQAASAAVVLDVDGCVPPVADFTAALDGLAVRLLDRSRDDAQVVAWAWDFGDGAQSGVPSPVHTYTAAGTYVVRLRVTDDEGDTSEASRVLQIVAPGASGAAGGAGDSGLPAGASAPPVPSPSASAAPVNRPPVARAAAPAQAAPGAAVRLDPAGTHDPDGDALHLAWTQVAGPPVVLLGTDGAASFLAPAAGRLVFELRAEDGLAAATAQVEVLVLDAADEPDAEADGRAAFVATRGDDALDVAFEDAGTAGDGATHRWDFGDGTTSDERAPRHRYAAPGTYTVRLVVVEEGHRAEATQTVEVLGAPAAEGPVDLHEGTVPATRASLPHTGLLWALAVAVIALLSAMAAAALRRR